MLWIAALLVAWVVVDAVVVAVMARWAAGRRSAGTAQGSLRSVGVPGDGPGAPRVF